jgi:cytosolic iron-sulfur protein assembly protein CIAO1
MLASCSADKSVRLYSYSPSGSPIVNEHTTGYEPSPHQSFTFKHISTIDTGHAKTVRAIAWAPSGSTLATASFDSNIGIWEQEPEDNLDADSREWECTSLLEGHETECKSVAYSASGTLLASCSRDKTVWVWEGSLLCASVFQVILLSLVHPDSDFECLAVMMEHTQDVKSVTWHPAEEVKRASTPSPPRLTAHSVDTCICIV